jgi:multimeric flavodoxin WrbA
MSNILIINGSSRVNGHTETMIRDIFQEKTFDIVHLNELNISYYDYEHENIGDEFIAVARRMVQYDIVVFASPVYANGISAQLKTFFDRTTDLIEVHTNVLEKLQGKKCFFLACGHKSVPGTLAAPIEQTCAYLGLQYQKMFFFQFDSDGKMIEDDLNRSDVRKQIFIT